MTTIAEPRPVVTGGVDTHLDLHVAAAVTAVGGVLGTAEFPTTAAGYRRLLAWMRTFGELDQVGVEGTGTYGCPWSGTCVRSRSRSLRSCVRTGRSAGGTGKIDVVTRSPPPVRSYRAKPTPPPRPTTGRSRRSGR